MSWIASTLRVLSGEMRARRYGYGGKYGRSD